MKLIISEKPSQASEYAKVLGGFTKKDGYFESNNSYIVWCFGHLIELENDTVYREKGNWSKSYLPLIPEKFQYCIGTKDKKTDEGKSKQVELIRNLAEKSTELINATDADREGELIFLYVYNYLGLTLPYSRLWISSLTEGDIKKGFNNLLKFEDVENLGKAGYARAIADWLVGINGTQASTLQLGGGKLLTIGRVQTAILKIICERYLKNKAHEKSYTYKIKAFHNYNEQKFFSETEIFETKESIALIFEKIGIEHILKNIEQKNVVESPPLLHSIDSLIVEANKIFSMSGETTLQCAQSLYEKKLTTYPRTDSQYINEEGFEKLKEHIDETSKFLNIDSYQFNTETPKSVNEKKLTGSHDAIVPTGYTDSFSSLNENELNVYKLINLKVLQSFSTKAIYDTCKYTFENNGVEFFSKTKQLIDLGWKKYLFQKETNNETEKEEQEQQQLKLTLDDNVGIDNKEIKEIESKPPALFTDASLTPVLKNIGKFLNEENPSLAESLKDKIDLKTVQIGTQATRPSIMERLKKLNFIELDKKKYVPTETGLAYYTSIRNLEVTNIGNTAVMEYELKKIAEGRMEEATFYNNLKKYISSIVEDIFTLEYKAQSNDRKSFGECPKCKKGVVVEGKMAYGCNEYKNGCDFVIWKKVAQKTLTEKNIIDLLEKQKTPVIKGFKSKAGKTFDAQLILKEDFKVEFNFTQTKK